MTVPYDPSFSLETLTLPHEDPAEHRRIENEWMTAYPCGSPIEKGFLRQAMVAEMEKRRVERARATVRADRVRTAVRDFEHQQEDEVSRCVGQFSDQCEYWLRHLLRSAAGCRWAIAKWEELHKKLVDDGTWYGADRITAIQLQGFSALLDQLCFYEQGYQTWLDCLVAQPNPKQRDIDLILDWHRVPKSMQDRDVTALAGRQGREQGAAQGHRGPRAATAEGAGGNPSGGVRGTRAGGGPGDGAGGGHGGGEGAAARRTDSRAVVCSCSEFAAEGPQAGRAARVPMVERELRETWSVERASWIVDREGETGGPGGRSEVVVRASPAPIPDS